MHYPYLAGVENGPGARDILKASPAAVLDLWIMRRQKMAMKCFLERWPYRQCTSVGNFDLDRNIINGMNPRILWAPVLGILTVFLIGHSAQAVDLSYKEILRLWAVNGQLQVWQPGSGPAPTEPSLKRAEAFSWDPAGHRLAISYSDALRIWDIDTGRIVEQIPDVAGGDVAWSPDGKWLATNSDAGLQIRDAQSGTLVQTCGNVSDYSNVAWDPDSLRVAASNVDPRASSYDQSIIFCRIGSEVRSTILPAYYPDFLAFSPGGEKLAAISDSYDYTPYTRVYDMATGRLDVTLRGAYALAWSPDGKHLATTTSGAIEIRDVENYLPLVTIPQTAPVLAWRPGANRLITVGANDTLSVFDTVNGALLATIPGIRLAAKYGDGTPDAIQWASDGSKFALLDGQGVIRVFAESGNVPISTPPASPVPLQIPVSEIRTVSSPSNANPVKLHGIGVAYNESSYSWSTDGSVTFRVEQSTVEANVWNLFTAMPSYDLLIRLTDPTTWAVSPDGKRLAVASSLADARGNFTYNKTADASTLQVWTVDATLNIAAIPNNDVVRTIRWSPNGKWIAVIGADNHVSLWDAAQKRRVYWAQESDEAQDLAWSPDGSIFASVDTGTLYVINPAQPGNVRSWILPDVTGPIVWSPDGTKVAAASDYGLVRVWDVKTQQLIDTVKGHYSMVSQVVWASDNRTLASLSYDVGMGIMPNLIVENTVERKTLANLTGFSPLGLTMAWYTPTQLIIAEEDGGQVQVFDTQSEALRLLVKRGGWMAAAISADGRWLAYAFRGYSGDRNIGVMDVATGQAVVTLPSNTDLYDLEWSPDAHQLVSVDENNSAILWSDH